MIESARKCYFWAFYPISAYGRPGRLSCRRVPGRHLTKSPPASSWLWVRNKDSYCCREESQLFKERRQDNYSDGNLAFDDNRTLDLRSIIHASIDLPTEVLGADFSHVHDRILDQKTISDLIKPSTSGTDSGDWSKRCHRRKEVLMPYLDQRLICVCIRLPGVIQTIEIDPQAQKVIHWEWQSV